jgi:hypothetical protein
MLGPRGRCNPGIESDWAHRVPAAGTVGREGGISRYGFARVLVIGQNLLRACVANGNNAPSNPDSLPCHYS